MRTAHGFLIDNPNAKIKDQAYSIKITADGKRYKFQAHIRDTTRHLDFNKLAEIQEPKHFSHRGQVSYTTSIIEELTKDIRQEDLDLSPLTDVITVETTFDRDMNIGGINISRAALANTRELSFDKATAALKDPNHPYLGAAHHLAKNFIGKYNYAVWAMRYPDFYQNENMAQISEEIIEENKSDILLKGEDLAEVLSILTNNVVAEYMIEKDKCALFRDNEFDPQRQRLGGLRMSKKKIKDHMNTLKHTDILDHKYLFGDLKHFGLPYVNITTAFRKRESLVNQLLLMRTRYDAWDCVPNDNVEHIVEAMNTKRSLKGHQNYPRF